MTTSKWIYRKSDNQFLRGGFYDPGFDPTIEGLSEFPDADPHPNSRTERHDAASPTKKRPATAAEIASFDAAQVDAEGAASIDDKKLKAIVLTLLFFINELRTQPTTAFPALTAAQVRDRFLTIWRGL